MVTCSGRVSDLAIRLVQLADIHRYKNTGVIRPHGVYVATISTSVDLVVSNTFFVDFVLNLSLLEGSSLTLVVTDIGLLGKMHGLDHFCGLIFICLVEFGELD